MTTRHWTPNPAAAGPLVQVTPEDAGWRLAGLSVYALAPGAPLTIRTAATEVFVVPLAGSVRVEIRDEATGGAKRPSVVFDLAGRAGVFTRVSDFAYAGRDSVVTLTSAGGGQVAVPSARCTQRLAPRYGAADDVVVEIRGAGQATRQVTNFGVPGVWDHAEKLICCEVLTPAGNWSSYPPHKHDPSEPCPTVNEEIYLYRIAGADQVTPDRSGVGFHRTYTTHEHDAVGLSAIDDLFEVRDLDTVLVPHGYHGPSIAAPGYPMYYLNVMAGPAAQRAMAFCDDPAHGWIRDDWAGQRLDPRCPMTSAVESRPGQLTGQVGQGER
jgi:5-deoxy-glucuronate isomerase